MRGRRLPACDDDRWTRTFVKGQTEKSRQPESTAGLPSNSGHILRLPACPSSADTVIATAVAIAAIRACRVERADRNTGRGHCLVDERCHRTGQQSISDLTRPLCDPHHSHSSCQGVRPVLLARIMDRWIMGGKGRVFRQYKSLSPDDRRTFNRWLEGNAVVGFILVAGLVAMALSASSSGREPVLASGKQVPDLVATAQK